MCLVLFRRWCNPKVTLSPLLPSQQHAVNVASVISYPEGADYMDKANHDSFYPMGDTYMSSHKLTCTLAKNMTSQYMQQKIKQFDH